MEVGVTVELVMQELHFSNPYRLVWQSKVGPAAWLSPSTDEAITGLVKRGHRNILLVPIAFTSDHIETLHELDIEYAHDLAKKVGAEKIVRSGAPNDHPMFIDTLVDIVKNHLYGKVHLSPQFLMRCPLCVNSTCGLAKSWFLRHVPDPLNQHGVQNRKEK
ncbi:unnamed protein product [Darwinula stevensoni]|uniref:Ferrochelatase n=1 Tax=Darwinula stevensoni TaxID=69355 RepID=A0A7R8ZY96_9CRUS|nr:unnamed protein product [Darwinula stevensoni]CAG0881113.1 unnamed protein product [Darwinula stevensoni]